MSLFTGIHHYNEPVPCQRCRSKVSTLHEVTDRQNKKLVCDACRKYYETKLLRLQSSQQPVFTAQASSQVQSVPTRSSGPDISVINRNVINAVRKGTGRGNVQPLPALPNASHGTMQQAGMPPPRQPATGYSNNHYEYHAHRDYWHGQTQFNHNDFVKVNWELGYIDLNGDLGVLKEFMASDACYNAHKLPGVVIEDAIEKIWPTVLQKLHGDRFNWADQKFDIMNIGTNMREYLSKVDQNTPYFLNLYTRIVPNKKGLAGAGVKQFKAPPAPCRIALVITRSSWHAYQKWLKPDESFTPPSSAEKLPNVSKAEVFPVKEVHGTNVHTGPATSISMMGSSVGQNMATGFTSTQNKRSRKESQSVLSSSKRHATSNEPKGNSTSYPSDNDERSKEQWIKLLARGGARLGSGSSVENELPIAANVQLVPQASFESLMQDPNSARFDFDMDEAVYVRIICKDEMGREGFKTAQEARLEILSASGRAQELAEALGGSADEPIMVALKQMYRLKADKVTRYQASTERASTILEANIHRWATVLWEESMSFIKVFFKTNPKKYNTMVIPKMRYVRQAIVFTQTKDSRTMILEELIDPDVQFYKYIHNAGATPLVPEAAVEAYDKVLFLCCTQHIQYVRTFGLAFISDYQGGGNLLTDPQVLTAPNLGLYDQLDDNSVPVGLFGEGNVTELVQNFPTRHACNRYCEFFELTRLDAAHFEQLGDQEKMKGGGLQKTGSQVTNA